MRLLLLVVLFDPAGRVVTPTALPVDGVLGAWRVTGRRTVAERILEVLLEVGRAGRVLERAVEEGRALQLTAARDPRIFLTERGLPPTGLIFLLTAHARLHTNEDAH